MYAPPRRSRSSRLGSFVLAVGVIALGAGTLIGTASIVGSALSPAFGTPPATPRHSPVASVGQSEDISAASDEVGSSSPAPSSGASGGPTASPSPSPKPGPFAMDLYRAGAFVGEKIDVWCLPAAMQTSANIMDLESGGKADRTRARQQELFTLARKLAPAPDKAAEPEGWAQGLTKLGYGKYEVRVLGSIKSAIHIAAKAIRATGRPAGLLVWRGAHSWVMSGFKATADPALTDKYTVTAVYIEDVWYPRISSIWGSSDPPDTLVAVSRLPIDFKPWKRPQAKYPDKDGRYVIVVPVG